MLWTKHDRMSAFYSGRGYALQYYGHRTTEVLLDTIRAVRLAGGATARGIVAGCAEIIRGRK